MKISQVRTARQDGQRPVDGARLDRPTVAGGEHQAVIVARPSSAGAPLLIDLDQLPRVQSASGNLGQRQRPARLLALEPGAPQSLALDPLELEPDVDDAVVEVDILPGREP